VTLSQEVASFSTETIEAARSFLPTFPRSTSLPRPDAKHADGTKVQAIVARSENFSPCNGRNFDVIFVFVLGVSKCLKWPIRPNCSFGIVAICVPLPRMRAVAVIAFSCPLLPF